MSKSILFNNSGPTSQAKKKKKEKKIIPKEFKTNKIIFSMNIKIQPY